MATATDFVWCWSSVFPSPSSAIRPLGALMRFLRLLFSAILRFLRFFCTSAGLRPAREFESCPDSRVSLRETSVHRPRGSLSAASLVLRWATGRTGSTDLIGPIRPIRTYKTGQTPLHSRSSAFMSGSQKPPANASRGTALHGRCAFSLRVFASSRETNSPQSPTVWHQIQGVFTPYPVCPPLRSSVKIRVHPWRKMALPGRCFRLKPGLRTGVRRHS